MQTIEIENNLNLSILPENAQEELIDFYQFLVEKYTKKNAVKKIVNSTQHNNIQALKGVFKQYADSSKLEMEKTAWKNQLRKEYSHD
jgi:hypothetical protein